MSRLPAVKVLVTRPKQQAFRLAEKLVQAGAEPIMVPLLNFQSRFDDKNEKLCQEGERFDWLFSPVKTEWSISMHCCAPIPALRSGVIAGLQQSDRRQRKR